MNIQKSFMQVQSEKTPVTANLHEQFVSLNFQIIGMKNKLMALLLEIYQKEVYKEHKCVDIFEYAFKFARISRERVQKALRTLKNTEDKPLLRAQIAIQGLNKVAMVAKLATPETEKFFAQHVESMPQPVLQTFVKEIRAGKPEVPKMSIELDEEMQIIFNQLKQKHEKQLKKELSNQAALRMILKEVFGKPGSVEEKRGAVVNSASDGLGAKDVSEDEILMAKREPATAARTASGGEDVLGGDGILKEAKNRASIGTVKESKNVPEDVQVQTKILKNINVTTTEANQKSKNRPDASYPTVDAKIKPVPEDGPPKFASRTIPITKRREITAKQNGKCAYPCCTKTIENFHHTIPFAFNRSHGSVVGLCKIHHEFCHHGVVRHELDDPSKWRLSLEPHLSQFDALKLRYRKST